MSSYDKNQAYSAEWSDDEQPTAYSSNENGGNRNSFEDDSSTGRGVRVRALYDYDGQEQDELTFKAGRPNHLQMQQVTQAEWNCSCGVESEERMMSCSLMMRVLKKQQLCLDLCLKAPFIHSK